MSRAAAIFAGLLLLPVSAFAASLSPSLEQRVASMGPDETVPVILNLGERVDVARFKHGRSSAGDMIAAMRGHAQSSQARLLAILGGRASVTGVRPFWICNSVAARVPVGMLAELRELREIESIDFDEPVGFDGGLEDNGVLPEWNLTMVRADQVWNTYGLSGSGIVVGSMDTGFDPAHPALAGKWRGGTNSWIDIINGLPAPYDDHGHGSHTIGTMVGGDGPGPFLDDVGVAYGATFVSAKVLDATNSFSSASIVIAGAQWMLDPDGDPKTDDFPDVINNSWFFFSPTFMGYHTTVAAWRAAGIVPVFCIGNSGPGFATTRVPGSYNNTLGVGATTSADVIASFSSRGPSPVGAEWPADQRKPDLSAPGQLVRSSLPGGIYQAWSGTSMAAPHVAGTVALMLQGRPSMDYTTIASILLTTTVDRGPVGYDFDYGHGRLDAFAATTLAVTDVGNPTIGRTLRISPNPFRERVRIDYAATASGPASLEVFDLAGRRVWSIDATGAQGELGWDGRDADGAAVPAGVYLVRLTRGGEVTTGRMLRLR